jgi:hypothetical protein
MKKVELPHIRMRKVGYSQMGTGRVRLSQTIRKIGLRISPD